MNKKHSKTIKDLLEIFEDSLTVADILSAEIQSQICLAIVKERLARGMNQKQFADLLEVSQGMVSRWEGSDYNFTIKTLAKIADKLDLTIDLKLVPNTPRHEQDTYYRKTSNVTQFPVKNTDLSTYSSSENGYTKMFMYQSQIENDKTMNNGTILPFSFFYNNMHCEVTTS